MQVLSFKKTFNAACLEAKILSRGQKAKGPASLAAPSCMKKSIKILVVGATVLVNFHQGRGDDLLGNVK